jgi:hypothetical protein
MPKILKIYVKLVAVTPIVILKKKELNFILFLGDPVRRTAEISEFLVPVFEGSIMFILFLIKGMLIERTLLKQYCQGFSLTV